MKVTICNDCGLTMQSGVTACRRCNQNRLRCYDLHCESDTFVMHKRCDELNPQIQKKRAHPNFGAFIVLGVTLAAIVVYESNVHPYGAIGRTTYKLMDALQQKPALTAAKISKRQARNL